jgi:hypothetical protein
MLSVLGLPQVSVQSADIPIPACAHTVVLLTPEMSAPADVSAGSIWRSVDPGTQQKKEHVSLPNEIRTEWIPSREALKDSAQAAKIAAFWLRQRLQKRSDLLSSAEFLDWCCVLRGLNIAPQRSDSLLEWVLEAMNRRRPTGVRRRKINCTTVAERDALLRLWVSDLSSRRIGLKDYLRFLRNKFRGVYRSGRGVYADDPARWIWRALETAGTERTPIAELEKLFAQANNSRQLLIVLAGAAACERTDLLQAASAKLMQAQWTADGSVFPLLVPEKSTLCFSPLMLYKLTGAGIPEGLFDPVVRVQPLRWPLFKNGEIFDWANRHFSSFLIDNWIVLHTAPAAEGQFLLHDHNYDEGIYHLERLLFSFFERLQHAAQRPLLKLHPWPASYTAALSVRYDVDRPIRAGRAVELAKLQARHFKYPCGSWYFRAGDNCIETVAPFLERYWQEVGYHLSSDTEAVADAGATYHSAPTSDYWRAALSVEGLKRANALYGEFMIKAINTPREIWTPASPIPAVVGTPLHFPLEGGTDDDGLAYFDRLLTYFRNRLAAGGHAIIASHPDLNQTLLEKLAEREDLTGVWLQTIQNVIVRHQAVMSYGSITVAGWDQDVPLLVSKHHLADVKVEIRPAGLPAENFVVQLRRGIPRPLWNHAGDK